MSNSSVSVIVPIYKVEQYLDRCVQSVVNQTYQNNEELRRRFGQQAKSDMEIYRPEKIWDKWEELMRKVVGK